MLIYKIINLLTINPKTKTLHSKNRHIYSFSSSNHRVIAALKQSSFHNNGVHVGNIEMDTHADTIVAGRNCIVLHGTGRECDVSPYSSDYEPLKGVPIVTAATAWQSPESGQTYILVFNEALWMPNMATSLINPNQLRYYGVTVQDNPVSETPLHIRTEDASFYMRLNIKGTVLDKGLVSPISTIK